MYSTGQAQGSLCQSLLGFSAKVRLPSDSCTTIPTEVYVTEELCKNIIMVNYENHNTRENQILIIEHSIVYLILSLLIATLVIAVFITVRFVTKMIMKWLASLGWRKNKKYQLVLEQVCHQIYCS